MSRRVTYYNSSYASFQYDVDALEFITNWEINTGVIMHLTQRIAVNDWYRGMKGDGTTHGTDLLTIARSVNARIYILIPLDDSNASASAYELDAVSNGVLKGSYNNMIPSDFTQNGVIGGSGKYFDMGISPDDTTPDDTFFGIYTRTNVSNGGWGDLGSQINSNSNLSYIFSRASNNARCGSKNNSAAFLLSNTTGGFLGFSRSGTATSGSLLFRNGILTQMNSSNNSQTALITGSNPDNFYAHAVNENGSPVSASGRQLCFYIVGFSSLTFQQSEDLHTVTQRLQSNVITGGRQIGTAIPPI
jgi:hypothetical protein